MDKRIAQISDFFSRYENRFMEALAGKADIEGTAGSFASSFIGANPLGVACGANDEQFRKALLDGYEFYRNIGITSMSVLSEQTSILDDFHAMTKIRWRSEFTRKDSSSGAIEFDNIYFLQSLDGTAWRIFAYITGDEQKALKEHGLV